MALISMNGHGHAQRTTVAILHGLFSPSVHGYCNHGVYMHTPSSSKKSLSEVSNRSSSPFLPLTVVMFVITELLYPIEHDLLSEC